MLSNQIRRKIKKELAERSIEVSSIQSRIIGFLYKESFKRDIFQKDIEEEFEIRRSCVTNIYILVFYVDKLWNVIYTKRVLSSCL